VDIICSPKGIMGIIRPGQGMSDLRNAGFEKILLDLSMLCTAGELKTVCRQEQAEEPALASAANPILERFKTEHLCSPIARAPYLLRNIKREDMNGRLKELAEESIEICQKAGASQIIVRPLFAGISDGNLWEVNREYYLALAEAAKKKEVMILLENQCRDKDGHLMRGVCADAEEAVSWVDALNAEAGEERFGFCIDAGVCRLCGQNMQDVVVSLGRRIKAVVLRDCNGVRETSQLPFTCSDSGQSGKDWIGLIRGLREVCFDGHLILDFSTTAAAFSPLLRPELLRLAQSVAEYFKWQIEMETHLRKYPARVLFGAGNMCRNYMKCYGEKYPPLYTCDNNASLWGTVFCGLEVKPPECLKELPENCVIYICNIYYREIEKQLREMGIRNRIAFFNDEYMPSFHFDRLKREEKL